MLSQKWPAWAKAIVFSLIGLIPVSTALLLFTEGKLWRRPVSHTQGENKPELHVGTELRLRVGGPEGPIPLARTEEVSEEMQGADELRIKRMFLEGKFLSVGEGTLVRLVDCNWSGACKIEILEGEHSGEYAWAGRYSLTRLLAAQSAHQVTGNQFSILLGLKFAVNEIDAMLDNLDKERRRGDVEAVCSRASALDSRASTALNDMSALGFPALPATIEKLHSGFLDIRSGSKTMVSACRSGEVRMDRLSKPLAEMAGGRKKIDTWDKNFDY